MVGQRNLKDLGTNEPAEIRVAQYVRMSTDHQRYSTENQATAIQQYADKHGMTIVRTYADEGKSGLSIGGREALKRLIYDVQNGNTDFEAILVYDISRWGRFQDADESAYYEYLCRRAGIRLIYCAEQFSNDGSMSATVMKSLKRVMAGEYSRELSAKVFIGQCRLVELGFRQGGLAGYGLRRLLIDEKGEPKAELKHGEKKSLQTDRVVLIPGPADEIAVVSRIYQMFVVGGLREQAIAAHLNAEGIRTDLDKPWSRGSVHQVLTNEKYIGNNVYNRNSFKLKMKRVRNTPDMWIRHNGAFEGIVDIELFQKANALIAERARHYNDQEMLELLSRLFSKTGVLSGLIIDEQEAMPSSSAYRHRFGSLIRAYALVGYQPDRDYRYIEINNELRRKLPAVIGDVITGLQKVGAAVAQEPGTDLLTINDEFTASVVIARCQQTESGSYRWRIRFDTGLLPDITVVVRMHADNQSTFDYYLFPHIDLPLSPVRLAEENHLSLDAYRFDTLDALYGLAARSPIRRTA